MNSRVLCSRCPNSTHEHSDLLQGERPNAKTSMGLHQNAQKIQITLHILEIKSAVAVHLFFLQFLDLRGRGTNQRITDLTPSLTFSDHTPGHVASKARRPAMPCSCGARGAPQPAAAEAAGDTRTLRGPTEPPAVRSSPVASNSIKEFERHSGANARTPDI